MRIKGEAKELTGRFCLEEKHLDRELEQIRFQRRKKNDKRVTDVSVGQDKKSLSIFRRISYGGYFGGENVLVGLAGELKERW